MNAIYLRTSPGEPVFEVTVERVIPPCLSEAATRRVTLSVRRGEFHDAKSLCEAVRIKAGMAVAVLTDGGAR